MKRAILYGRVSTSGQSLEPQFIELRALAKARGWTVVREVGDVISGTKSSRTGLNAMMKLVQDGAVDVVAAVKLDRVGRSTRHLWQVFEDLEKAKVALVVPGQGIDTSDENPASKLLRGMIGLMAEFERNLISERTKAGLAARKAAGIQLGRPSLNLRVDWPEITAKHLAERGGEVRDLLQLARDIGGVSTATAHKLAHRVLSERKSAAA